MPPPDAQSSRPLNIATAKRTIPQCACQWSENTEKLQETCTRPICMHAKTPVTSVACGIRGRRFYLALFPSLWSPRPFIAPIVRHCMLGRDIVNHERSHRSFVRVRAFGGVGRKATGIHTVDACLPDAATDRTASELAQAYSDSGSLSVLRLGEPQMDCEKNAWQVTSGPVSKSIGSTNGQGLEKSR